VVKRIDEIIRKNFPDIADYDANADKEIREKISQAAALKEEENFKQFKEMFREKQIKGFVRMNRYFHDGLDSDEPTATTTTTTAGDELNLSDERFDGDADKDEPKSSWMDDEKFNTKLVHWLGQFAKYHKEWDTYLDRSQKIGMQRHNFRNKAGTSAPERTWQTPERLINRSSSFVSIGNRVTKKK